MRNLTKPGFTLLWVILSPKDVLSHFGNERKVDGFQKTNVGGVFACGDNSSMMRSVANAVHTGNLALPKRLMMRLKPERCLN